MRLQSEDIPYQIWLNESFKDFTTSLKSSTLPVYEKPPQSHFLIEPLTTVAAMSLVEEDAVLCIILHTVCTKKMSVLG